MKIHALFPTLIYEHKGTMDEIFLVQDEIKRTLPLIESQDAFVRPDGWTGGVRTNIKSRHNTIVDFKMTNLQRYIETHVKHYIDKAQTWHPVKIGLVHSWFNKTDKGEGQEWHQHQDAMISGVYYYQTTGNDGVFGIQTPVPQLKQELFPFGNISVRTVEMRPQVGTILLFPGWLEHCVAANTTDSTRISVSFNFQRDYWTDLPVQDRNLI